MASRPSEKLAWVPSNDPAKIVAPSASKKNTGWLQEEKPPFQYFNWCWNLLDAWTDFFGGQVRYNVTIDSDTSEGDYTTLAGYLAASPASGDRVLMRVDETITATLVIPAGVLVHLQKGKSITTTTVFTPIVSLASGAVLEGDFKLNASSTGTIAKGLSVIGDGCRVDNFILENTTSGIVTGAVVLETGATTNNINGEVLNTGAGSITNISTDTAANGTNQYNIRHATEIDHQPIYSSGNAVQVVNVQDGAVATGSTVVVNDDSVPQQTEGDEYMTLDITPTKATNKLKIEVVAFLANSAQPPQFLTGALFKDAAAGALAVGIGARSAIADAITTIIFTHTMVAGATASTTFKFRGGGPDVGTTTFNGSAGARLFGGVIASSITITEIEV